MAPCRLVLIQLLLLAILLHFDRIIAQDNQGLESNEIDDNDDNDEYSPELHPTNSTKKKKRHRVAVFNDSPLPLAVYRVHQDHGEEKLITPPEGVVPGGNFGIMTATGEHFVVYELPDPTTEKCRNATTTGTNESCRRASFVIPVGLDSEITIGPDFEATVMDATMYARQRAKEALTECYNLQDEEQLEACLLEATTKTLKHWQGEWKFHQTALKKIGQQLEKYACQDANNEDDNIIETTSPRRSFQWESRDQGMLDVDILHKHPASQIHVIHNFVEPAECQAVREAVPPELHMETVIMDHQNRSTKLSTKHQQQQQRAWQATIETPSDSENQHYPLAALRRRVFDYTNYALGWNISEHGQEPPLSIRYYGPEHYSQRRMEQALDQYPAHCDGPCDGGSHQPLDRVATMILYCQTATQGGHVHFRNAGVHIVPEIGMGVFVSYVNPSTLERDTGFTEHSGCPVFQGDKHIVTQYIRRGVSQENPWDQ